MRLATKTLEAIKQSLESDNCGKFRQQLAELLPKMEDAYRGQESKYRSHQGASSIGEDCARKLQLKWRWVNHSTFDERMLRLFNRGHLEEARFLSMLMCIPEAKLWYETEDGGQFKFSDYAGHYGSALDGVLEGCPDLNGEPCYTEFKTASDKKFKEFAAKGCREVEYKYFVQCQQCMLYFNLPFTLFMVVNKNTDELHAEIIEFDQSVAMQYKERASQIIFTTDPLATISNNPTFWKCRFCDVKGVCHGKEIPDVNCRTCAHWTAEETGGYSCARGHTELVNDKSRNCDGCAEHVFDPTLLVKYDFMGGNAEGNYTVLRDRKGNEFKQGPNHVKSSELSNFKA